MGFLICTIAGYAISKKARFDHFARFILPIQPQTQYYPTAHELLATARHEVFKDKILVLIGGNSILKGIGQNPDELWSNELQKLLGDHYKVLNYAMDGATFTSFGATAFRILSEHYKKIIFVDICTPGGVDPIDGMEVYSYLFWDAYYKKLFHPDAIEKNKIIQLRKKQLSTTKGMELHTLSFLDSLFYFRNLWNWIGYHFIFTVWTDHVPKAPFRHRIRYSDRKTPHLKQLADESINTPENFKKAIQSISGYVSGLIETENDFRLKQDAWIRVSQVLEDSFSPQYRAKILCLIPVANPKFIMGLPKQFPQAYDLLIEHSQKLLEEQGYHAMAIGKKFLPEDYIDQGHFLASGGKKVANLVEKEVRKISLRNGYV